MRRATRFAATPLVAAAVLLCMAGAAPAQTATEGFNFPPSRPGTGRPIDVPEQIPLQTGPSDAVRIEGIAPRNGADPVAVEQPGGTVDLCDPSVPESRRRAAGVDCDRAEVQSPPPTTGRRPRAGTASDPLLTPRDPGTREGFKELDLGDDVPPTVILQN